MIDVVGKSLYLCAEVSLDIMTLLSIIECECSYQF